MTWKKKNPKLFSDFFFNRRNKGPYIKIVNIVYKIGTILYNTICVELLVGENSNFDFPKRLEFYRVDSPKLYVV